VGSQTHQFESVTAPSRRTSDAAVDVVLLSADEQIFETTRNAVAEQHPVWRAQSADEAIDFLVSGRCGVLVIDLGTLATESTGLIRQVTQQFPDVVVVAAGRQTDEPLIAGMVSDGLVYRFMHKPLSPNRAGMFLAHAIRAHTERREQPGIVQVLLPNVTHVPDRIERKYWYYAAAGALVVVIGLTVWLGGGDDEPDADTTARESADASALPGGAARADALLIRANAALEAGQLESPERDNALDLFRDILFAQPQHTEARAGLERTAGLVLTKAHAESVAGRAEEARRLVRRVLSADPANSLALAMQARLEVPAPIANAAAASRAPETGETFVSALQREFATRQPARHNPAPTPVVARPAAAPAVDTVRSDAASAAPAALTAAAAAASANAGMAGGATLSGSVSAALPVAPAASGSAPGSAGGASTVAPASSSAGAEPTGSGPSLVPLREFTRVSTTEPIYPPAARSAGTEGWVRLEFTVTERGQVRDIVVVGAEPRGAFESAATSALRRWRFRPPVAASGQPVALRTSVVLQFELQD
jgi:TonB family protein